MSPGELGSDRTAEILPIPTFEAIGQEVSCKAYESIAAETEKKQAQVTQTRPTNAAKVGHIFGCVNSQENAAHIIERVVDFLRVT